MKKASLVILGLLFFVNFNVFAQESGNRIYGNQGYAKRQPQSSGGSLASADRKSYSIEANVLLNIKPDSFVAVFGVQQEGANAADSNLKVNAKMDAFSKALTALGVKQDDIYIDFITQNRVYDYKAQGNDVVEVQSGFETKKTIAVRYKDRALFERIVGEAVRVQIFDLIKVDYIVSDFDSVRSRLFEEAVRVVKAKEAKYTSMLGVKLPPVGLAFEKYDAFYPAELYQRYQAYEAGAAETNYDRGTKVTRRKSFTFFYEPLSVDRFDKMINPARDRTAGAVHAVLEDGL